MITWSYSLAPTAPPPASLLSAAQDVPNSAQFAISDLALDPDTWDLAFPPRLIYGAECIIQRIRMRFRWFLGEWFLDLREGVPYFQDILVKNPDLNLIQFIFRRVLTLTPGIKSVQSFDLVHDKSSRNLSVSFVATLVDGGIITAESEPFIVVP